MMLQLLADICVALLALSVGQPHLYGHSRYDVHHRGVHQVHACDLITFARSSSVQDT